jgi:hypothetical protein
MHVAQLLTDRIGNMTVVLSLPIVIGQTVNRLQAKEGDVGQ